MLTVVVHFIMYYAKIYNVCVCVREKYTLEQDIGDTEEAIRHKNAEVQVRNTVKSVTHENNQSPFSTLTLDSILSTFSV